MTDAEALKLALGLLHKERVQNKPTALHDNRLLEAIQRLEKMHRLYKMVDEVRQDFERKRRDAES